MTKIEKIIPKDKKRFFYSYMGEFFASEDIRKELGACMSNNDDYIWWVAFDEEKNVAGFCAAEIKKNCVMLKHDYVMNKYQNTGLIKKLINARHRYLLKQNQKMTIVAPPALVPLFTKKHFIETGKRGKYTLMTFTPKQK